MNEFAEKNKRKMLEPTTPRNHEVEITSTRLSQKSDRSMEILTRDETLIANLSLTKKDEARLAK